MGFVKVEAEPIDIITRAKGRPLRQFRDAAVFNAVLEALCSEIQVFLDAAIEVINLRMPEAATGEPLNAIGRIVGLGRQLVNFADKGWFTPDNPYLGTEMTPAWVTNAPLSDQYIASDKDYKDQIYAKVLRNFIQYASKPEIIVFVKAMWKIDCSVVHTGPMEVKIVVPHNTPLGVYNWLSGSGNTLQADNVRNVPIPAGVTLATIERLS